MRTINAKEKKMNKPKKFITGMLAMALALEMAGCAGFKNFLNPTYAINTSGEKVKAVLGTGQTVKIAEAEYQYAARPSVPSAPKKPNAPREPISPGDPPYKPTEPAGTVTYHFAGKAITLNWLNGKQLREILEPPDKYPIDAYARDGMQSQYDIYLQEVNQYNEKLSSYQNELAKYQQDTAKYQQDTAAYQQEVARYEQEMALYQSKLPEYTAEVEAEVMSIQSRIAPNAPSNWVGYVDEKYLLYRGKI
jgi:hypothetical protein